MGPNDVEAHLLGGVPPGPSKIFSNLLLRELEVDPINVKTDELP